MVRDVQTGRLGVRVGQRLSRGYLIIGEVTISASELEERRCAKEPKDFDYGDNILNRLVTVWATRQWTIIVQPLR